MAIPNLSGISFIQNKMAVPGYRPKRIRRAQVSASLPPVQVKKSKFIQDVDLLVTDYNDKAFLYDNGKVDIVKGNGLKTVRFPNKKAAALYLMKAGWKYV